MVLNKKYMKPEQTKISIALTDGNVVVLSFVTKEFAPDGNVNWEREANAENINAEIVKAGFRAASWRIITDADIPESREFRNAWRDNGSGKIAHDMVKVKGVHLGRLREARLPMFEQLDAEWMKATGQKDNKKADEVEAKRQKLRDITVVAQPLLDAAQTVDEVKAITLESLLA